MMSCSVPQHQRIDQYDKEEVFLACEWANDLPRKILGYRTPNELFKKELDLIYVA